MTKIKNALLNGRALTKFILFSFTMTIIYTIIAIVFQAVTGNPISDTLTTCYFAVYGGEVLSGALSKVFKLKEENNNEQ